ncbi:MULTISPECIES: bifunctional indole-3-glycerol-phosphate synthase TrpC/phosphoribosylanthranilate isomerase TrpF [unclassified Vibrio]|uniref:Multifunctional fusion protein n=1 Tax=Vibrio sp. HB236076 TaxID=3232307 RepID=A0AB39HB78_9VIBR|nr:bifunctional indole-3-glycerol-phosphate synthase TrpC/phosphoribosylanthranilate isomerase TrpF [Vibrio sp. HB161653]MDP5253547.1 bifunctional indole-3-glycerol-phosphate synthase TrpC/phosphoribosylanthranilate isomerase TrpF [Vibrio sp. HB161653]
MTQLSQHVSLQESQMAQVLVKIVNDKKQWVAARKVSQPLSEFQSQVQPSDRDFYQALTHSNSVFILECKKASPSKGLIRENFDLDAIAKVYHHHANAISVLTDEKYFQGQFDYINQVRRQVSQPVLCKDFMLDEYQVWLARHYQADAILLMLSVLDDEQYQQLADLAHQLNMGVLTEVSDEEELERAVALGAKVIGINNRNLRDLSTDLERTKTLAPQIRAKAPQAIVISESGIYTHQQVRELCTFADGFLIGSSLMAEQNLELAVRQVIYGAHKVCGLTSVQDAQRVYQAGAVFGGLIFASGSSRCVSYDDAKAICTAAPLRFVGVFQNQPIVKVADTANQLGFFAVQLHGEESESDIALLRQELNDDIEIWKAYGVQTALPELLNGPIDRHLLDSKVGHQSGGTGHAFDWSLLEHPERVMLAGGLGPDNVREALELGVLGLDFNSGVEHSAGVKDEQKVRRVFELIRQY